MAITKIYPNGVNIIKVPSTESIAISNYGGGIASIYYLVENANRPSAFQFQQTLENAGVVLGAFAAGKTVKIEAGGSTVVFDVGASPDTGIGDADTLGGQLPSYYAADSAVVHLAGTETVTGAKTHSSNLIMNNNTAFRCKNTTGTAYSAVNCDSSNTMTFGSTALQTRINSVADPVFGASNYKFWHENNDGAGSGLDADTVDGIQGSAIAQINATSGALQLPTLASDPSSGEASGQIYYNTTSNVVRFYNGSAWGDI